MANGSDAKILADRRKALEEQFFARQERELLGRMRAEAAEKERRQALAEASGIEDRAVLDRLAALNLDGSTIAALGLVPLVEVAWADGALHERERDAVVQAAEAHGVAPGSAAHDLLEGWLSQRPGRELLEAWRAYVSALAELLDETERRALRQDVVSRARAVAEAAGGILGLGKVSDAEERVLKALEAALS